MLASNALSEHVVENLPLIQLSVQGKNSDLFQLLIKKAPASFLTSIAEVCLNIPAFSNRKSTRKKLTLLDSVVKAKSQRQRRKAIILAWPYIKRDIAALVNAYHEKGSNK
jgi:hypothetical protein